MEELTKREIQDQLNKLGIHSSFELSLYSKEYEEYSANQFSLAYPPLEYKKTTEIDHQTQYTLARKFALTCRSLFPVLGNFLTHSRARAYKK